MTHRLASCSVGRFMVIAGLVVAHGWVAPRAVFAAESLASLGQVDGPAGQAVVESVEPVKPLDAPPGRAPAGPLAGALTALGPLALGTALWAQDDRPNLQRAGAYVMLAGFAAAPWVSNAITRRWRRAFGFGMTSLGTAAGALGQTRVPTTVVFDGAQRIVFVGQNLDARAETALRATFGGKHGSALEAGCAAGD